jgi:transglutaminase-like putative cysteine protease
MKRLLVFIFCTIVSTSVFVIAQEYPAEVQKYLEPGFYINSDKPAIVNKTKELVGDEKDPVKKAKVLYEFVRDEIHEKPDIDSYIASDILAKKIGICYHKSILLAALARAADIPAQLHFTEAIVEHYKDAEGNVWNIHGLHGATGLYLKDKWITLDTTGNLERWKIWMGEKPVTIELPFEFSAEHDVIWPSFKNRIIKKTKYKLFDWDEKELERIREELGCKSERIEVDQKGRDEAEYPLEVQKYLKPGVYVNSDHPAIIAKLEELVGDEKDSIKKAKILYEFVRDKIKEGRIYSMKASDVLAKAEGVCYEKASLLTALARAAGIPAALGYNEIIIKNRKTSDGKITDIHFLHGVTLLYLNGKWITLDQTGNADRWNGWVRDDPVIIKLPLEFSADHDVLFPSVGPVMIKNTPHKLFDHDINEKIRIGKLYGIDYSKD